MGYGLPAAIAAAPRPSRPAGRRARRRRRLRDDDGRARDGGPGEGAGSIAIVFDNERYGTIRMHQDRRGPGTTGRSPRISGPIDFAGIARACGARGIRVETDAAFEPALRQALANDRPTVIQVTLDRGWIDPDRPFAGAPRRRRRDADLPPHARRVVARRRSGGAAPVRHPSDDEGFIHCTDGADELVATANRHYREDPRPFVRPDGRPGPGRLAVARRGPERDLPARLRADRPRRDPGRSADPARRGRDVPPDRGLTTPARASCRSAGAPGRVIVSP